MNKLTEGTYVLTRDVVNPRSDRRVKQDWTRRTVWDKGTVLLAVDYDRSGGHPSLVLVGDLYAILNRIECYDEAYQTLVAALEPTEGTIDSVFTRRNVSNDVQSFARFMIETSRWSKNEFETLWDEYETYLNAPSGGAS